MENLHCRKYEILEKNSDGIEFKVFFDSLDEVMDALRDLRTMRESYDLEATIRNLQNLCESVNGRVFMPTKDDLPKARWVMLSAAASYPNGVPTSIPMDKLGINKAALQAYCSSKNNPTSKYLYIDNDLIFTNAEGIPWVAELLGL